MIVQSCFTQYSTEQFW